MVTKKDLLALAEIFRNSRETIEDAQEARGLPDSAIVSVPLCELLNTYDVVELLLAGCLELHEQLDAAEVDDTAAMPVC